MSNISLHFTLWYVLCNFMGNQNVSDVVQGRSSHIMSVIALIFNTPVSNNKVEPVNLLFCSSEYLSSSAFKMWKKKKIQYF